MTGEENIIVYPTDTVWGIGAAITDHEANQKVLNIKKNDSKKPLSILFQSLDQFYDYIDIPEEVTLNLKELYKHGVTLLLPAEWIVGNIPSSIYHNSEFVGARIASQELHEKLSQITSLPITTTSLNLSGMPPILRQQDAIEFHNKYLPKAHLILLSVNEMTGTPSTILSVTKDKNIKMVREGLNLSKIEKILGL